MPVPTVTLPAESDDASLQQFLQASRSAEKMDCCTKSVINGRWFTDRTLPAVQHFNYTGCERLEEGERLFAALPNLIGLSYFPVTKLTPKDSDLLEAIDRSGLWERLQYLYVRQMPSSNPFDPMRWPKLWQGRCLHFVEMNLHFENPMDASVIFQASFPTLERLSLSSCLGDPLLEWIMSSHLPSLHYLDLSFNAITSDALIRFAQTMETRSSTLTEISIDYGTNERVESYDWNGAVVDYYYGELSDEDITRQFLHGTRIKAVPKKTLYF